MNMRALSLILVVSLLAACGGNKMQRDRQEMMDRWEVLVRWSQYDALIDFIHPDYLEENPVTRLDIDRLSQFRVAEYRVRQVMVEPDGLGAERVVQIRMVHAHSQRERVINHIEIWRFDDDTDRWLLHSGPPDPRERY
jgi:hypothetical protein